jgi:hypothetical protein
VNAGEIQHHVEGFGRISVGLDLGAKAHAPALVTDVDRADLRLLGQTVRGHRLGDERQDRAQVGIVQTQHRHPVKRKSLHEIEKRLAQSPEVVAIRLHMIRVDVGHHREHGLQVEKRRVRFVGLDHDELAFAELRMRPGRLEPAADHERGIHASLSEHASDQTGGGGLAMRPGNCNALAQTHQLREHDRARHDGNAASARGGNFRIVGTHGRGDDHCVGALHLRRIVAAENVCAMRTQSRGHGGLRQIRAAYLVAQVEQHFSDAAHPGAADADEVDAFDFMLHRSRYLGSTDAPSRNCNRTSPRSRSRPMIGRARTRTNFNRALVVRCFACFAVFACISNFLRKVIHPAAAAQTWATVSVAPGFASERARSAISSNLSRVKPSRRSARLRAVRSRCWINTAAPASARNAALWVW